MMNTSAPSASSTLSQSSIDENGIEMDQFDMYDMPSRTVQSTSRVSFFSRMKQNSLGIGHTRQASNTVGVCGVLGRFGLVWFVLWAIVKQMTDFGQRTKRQIQEADQIRAEQDRKTRPA